MTDPVGDRGRSRYFSAAIDNLLALFAAVLVGTSAPVDPAWVRGVAGLAAYLGYYFVPEGLWGTTLGKRIFGLEVRRLDGTPARWKAALPRTLLRIIEVNPLFGALPAAAAIVISRRHQRIGDMLAGTVVVKRSPSVTSRA